MTTAELLEKLHKGDQRALARCISIVENDAAESDMILESLQINHSTPVIGITGPPGSGKSTLVNALISHLTEQKEGCKIAVLAVDPTSPFTHGSLLGDRLRMNEHYNNPNIFIRSIATRGALGGLSVKAVEISDVMCAAGFDYVFIETVGVGQSEVDIAALAVTTIVVMVPESGDEIQTIKSGIMEIADIFVVNKSDREGADRLVQSLKSTLHEDRKSTWEVPVVKTVASTKEGIQELFTKIKSHHTEQYPHRFLNTDILFDKAFGVAKNVVMKKIDWQLFKNSLKEESKKTEFNLYRFVAKWFK